MGEIRDSIFDRNSAPVVGSKTPRFEWHRIEIDGLPPIGILVVATNGEARWLDVLTSKKDELRRVYDKPATHWFPVAPAMPKLSELSANHETASKINPMRFAAIPRSKA